MPLQYTTRLISALGSLALAAGLGCAAPAAAYVGESYLKVPAIEGEWQGEQFRGWVRANGHYWKSEEPGIFHNGRMRFGQDRKFFSAPAAPADGPSSLVLALDKANSSLPALMAACREKASLGDVTYSEEAAKARNLREFGPRPAGIPEWFEYRLANARITACPEVEGAPEQALEIAFDDIDWLNYKGDHAGLPVPLQVTHLPRLAASGETRSFVVHWIAYAADMADDQCTQINVRPDQDAYYALLPADIAAAERKEKDANGGVGYINGEMELRGPNRMNATLLPGIVPDPGHIMAESRTARGLDLDGKRSKEDFRSEDGRTGIDNQLFRVMGCIKGHMGHKGFHPQYANESRRNGLVSIIVDISGIDDFQDDDQVWVSVLYSDDPMAKNADGSQILPDYTYRLSEDPQFGFYSYRFPARIFDGVIETEQVDSFQINMGQEPELTLFDAGMRLRILPDGSLKGVLAGYQDWHRVVAGNGSSTTEVNYGMTVPGMYNALRRVADGLPDPVSGEFLGISSAYDIEGVPAFLPPEQYALLVEPAPAGGGQ